MSTKSLDKALVMLTRTLASPRGLTAGELAVICDLPAATVYRQISALVRHGLLARSKQGRLQPGAVLVELFDKANFTRQITDKGRPHVEAISKKFKTVTHLGVLADDMVTYLIKSGPKGQGLFTEENKQLEAYCSGIGKVLLSDLPEMELETYLDTAPFPQLTENTITDPAQLAGELDQVRSQGYAIDDAEIQDGLFCVAVPIRNPEGAVIAGLSISMHDRDALHNKLEGFVKTLTATSDKISHGLYEGK